MCSQIVCHRSDKRKLLDFSGEKLTMKTRGKIIIAMLSGFTLLTVIYGLSAKEISEKVSIGNRFHHETFLTWRGVVADMFKPKPKKPAQYKKYDGAKKIKLPKAMLGGMNLEEAIAKRRSVRNYSNAPISTSELSRLLFAGQGITGKAYDHPLRTAPSAGALYPFEIYVVVNNVQELDRGLYHYSVLDHSLELIKQGDFRREITKAGADQDMLGKAQVTFVFSAIFDRVRCKYDERGMRYVYIEAGHICQNISLQAVSLGLGSVPVGAFFDEKVNHLIEVDGVNEAAVYILAVGKL